MGAVVGGVGGAIVGGSIGDNTPKFREYIVTLRRRMYAGSVAVGGTLPQHRITYYEVPMTVSCNFSIEASQPFDRLRVASAIVLPG